MKEGESMTVAIQNPSNVDLETAVIAVPHGHFRVHSWAAKSKSWDETYAEVLCHQDYNDTGVWFESCFLYANVSTPMFDFSLL